MSKIILVIGILLIVTGISIFGYFKITDKFFNNEAINTTIQEGTEKTTSVFMETLLTIISAIRGAVLFVISVLLFGAVFIVFLISARKIKQNSELESVQRDIIRKGKINVKRKKLNKFYTSIKGNKPVLEGKIIAQVEAIEDEKKYNIFAIRQSPLSKTVFIKMKPENHSKLFGDVISYNWNYILSSNNMFLIENTIEPKGTPQVTDKIGVNTLRNISPLISDSILANWYHRIKIREKKLIKLPESDIERARMG